MEDREVIEHERRMRERDRRNRDVLDALASGRMPPESAYRFPDPTPTHITQEDINRFRRGPIVEEPEPNIEPDA